MSVMAVPCIWPDVTANCCDDWDTYSPTLQAQAIEFATYILWSATGRQYGLCELTVRPCGRQCADCPSGWYWDGNGSWAPYIWNGQWKNCWCGGSGPGGCCTCDPACQVYLPGPVYSVTSVQVDGASLPVSGDGGFNYFVLDRTWLVRTDTTACWPMCADQNLTPGSPDAFEVTYLRGLPVPNVLANAAGTYACEYAKACTGAACRLPSRVTNISRQGVSISMVDINEILKNGLTGVFEVDQVIMNMNPYGIKSQARFYSPELPDPRQITFP